MTYAELIKGLWKKSELGVKEYAEAVSYSTTHISQILNDTQPGSLKALIACLKYAGIDIQDCLSLPDAEGKMTIEEQIEEARTLFDSAIKRPSTLTFLLTFLRSNVGDDSRRPGTARRRKG